VTWEGAIVADHARMWGTAPDDHRVRAHRRDPRVSSSRRWHCARSTATLGRRPPTSPTPGAGRPRQACATAAASRCA